MYQPTRLANLKKLKGVPSCITLGVSKYGAVKTWVDNIQFDSKSEAMRYAVLLSREKAGEISLLEYQVEYKILIDGKKRKYIADFVYIMDGKTVVEDVKNPALLYNNSKFALKKEAMEEQHGIYIICVHPADVLCGAGGVLVGVPVETHYVSNQRK